jgi:hypothetical protein
MIFRQLPSFSLSALSALALATGVACSGSGHSANKTTAAQPTAAAQPAEDAGGPPSTDPGTLPCNINTGYPGDANCIAPPDPAIGFQFHYGPSTYTDSNEVAKYLLMPGQEITDCVYFPSPNTTDIFFNVYHSRMRPHSHHMLLFIDSSSSTGAAPRTSSGPEQCSQGAMQRNLFGAQTPVLDATSLTGGNAPENDGIAVKIPPQQQIIMQVHFVNAGTTPILREAWANVLYKDPATVKILADPIFFIAGLSANLTMGQTQTFSGSATVPQGASPDFRLLLGTGHYHTHTTRFTAWKVIGGQKELLIDEFNALNHLPEPATWPFTTVSKNPAPDATNMVSGAYSGAVYMKPGDQIQWQCVQTNNNVSSNSPAPYNAAAITFGNAVFTGEMCNMFGLYAPTTGSPWSGFGL